MVEFFNRNDRFSYASIGGKMVNVYDADYYNEHRNVINQSDDIAIKIKNGDTNYVLPLVSEVPKDISAPGYYSSGSGIDFISFPTTAQEIKQFTPEIFEFGNIETMQELADAHDKFETVQNEMLEASNSATKYPVREKDSPVMKAVKEAINDKNMDIDNYKTRFGANFPNDKRKLNEDDMTFYLLRRYCSNLDLEADIVIRDAPGNIANPMGHDVVVNIWPGDGTSVEK